jgi:hypothetical protein
VGADAGGAGTTGSTPRDAQQQARETGREASGDDAQSAVDSSFQEGKGRVVSQMDSVARAFRQTAERLQGEDQGDLARYSERLSERVEQVSGYLRQKNIGALLDDLEGLAHRRPEVFLGTAFALGLLGARFLKSSERRDLDQPGRQPETTHADN